MASLLATGLLSSAALAPPTQAFAAVQDATYEIVYDATVATTPGSYSAGDSAVSVSISPAIVLQASANSASNGGAWAYMYYFFIVSGPDCGGCTHAYPVNAHTHYM